jgi:ubiquitin carboxyl-terminal hydrolase 7
MTLLLTWRAAVDIIRNNMAARQTDLRLYLDMIPDPSKVRLKTHIYSLTYKFM